MNKLALGKYAQIRGYFENDQVFKIGDNNDVFIRELLEVYDSACNTAARKAKLAMSVPDNKILLAAHKAEIMVGVIESILSNMCIDECNGDAVLTYFNGAIKTELNI